MMYIRYKLLILHFLIILHSKCPSFFLSKLNLLMRLGSSGLDPLVMSLLKFKSHLSKIEWFSILTFAEGNDNFSLFFDIFMSIFEHCFPNTSQRMFLVSLSHLIILIITLLFLLKMYAVSIHLNPIMPSTCS